MSPPPPASRSIVVWVLADPGDESLGVLDPAPAGVRFVVGAEPEEFDGAPHPDVVFDCSTTPTESGASAPRNRKEITETVRASRQGGGVPQAGRASSPKSSTLIR